ncbi:MAG: hypothetical protein PHD19_13070 [Dechloromonas sp.]|nr:hypothetical protein [Dechloromonas sp.]
MKTNLFRLGAISAALAPGLAQAIGFGEIVLQSQIGEPLRAEIPLLASPGEAVENACFSLAPVRGSDLPVVTAGRAQLVRSGQSFKLLVTGSKPIYEPIFMIGVKAGCGVDLERDYVLMPQAPLMPVAAPSTAAASTPPPAAATTRRSANYREVSARSGQTLEQIAEAQSPGNLVGQRRTLSAIKRLNPDLPAEQPLSEGTPVRVPEQGQRIAAESELAAPSAVERPAPPAAKPPKAAPAPRPKAQPAKAPPPPAKPKPAAAPAEARGDRLVLGAAPEDVRPPGRAASASDVEERIQKLESTIRQLNEELDKMNSVLALTTQALTAQQKLQQLNPPTAPPVPAVAVAHPADAPGDSNWLELLLSALLGSGIAVGIAQFLGRKRASPTEAELPLALASHRPEMAAPKAAGPAATAVEQQAPLPPVAVDNDEAVDSTQTEVGDASLSDDRSVLELAEMMLAYGRLRGAAETLAAHIEATSPDNILPWSMLLDLYRRRGMREEFETLAALMDQRFNVHLPAWSETTTPVSGLKSLEDYAHIIWRTTHTWGTQTCLDYLYALARDTRAGQRSGFPLEVIEEIALLMRILEDAYGLQRTG